MKLHRLIALGLCSFSWASTSHAQSMVLATSTATGEVLLERVHLATGAKSPVAGPLGAPLAFLDCGLSSWFDRGALDDEVPRLIEFSNGRKGVVLPEGGAGLVIHYARSGGTIFGFARIGLDGSASTLVEKPGIGPGGNIDPFDPTIAVSDDGDRIVISAAPVDPIAPNPQVFLIATDGFPLESGGMVKDILGGAATEVPGIGLNFVGDAIVAVSKSHLLFAVDDDGDDDLIATPLVAGPAPQYVHPELAVSSAAPKVVILAGADPTTVDLFEFDVGASTLRKITATPSWIVGPGNSMYTSKAPLLGITDSGSAVAFQRRIGSDSELFVADLGILASPFHLTEAPTFDAYIDQMSGLLTGGTRFAFFASGGYALKSDLYATETSTGLGYPTQNLTATSGTPIPPFADLAEMTVVQHFVLENSMMIIDDQRLAGLGYRFWLTDEIDAAVKLVDGLLAPPLFAASNEDSNSLVGTFELPGLSVLARFTTEPILGSPLPLLAIPSTLRFEEACIDRFGANVGVAVELQNGAHVIAHLSLTTGAIRIAPQGYYWDDVIDLEFGSNGALAWVNVSGAGARTARSWNPANDQTTAHGPHESAFWVH